MSDNKDFVIENGVLKKYVGSGGDVVIPEGVTEIGSSAFFGCKSLITISISPSVHTIGTHAFYGCRELKTITFLQILNGLHLLLLMSVITYKPFYFLMM